jgi:hypothetical protein
LEGVSVTWYVCGTEDLPRTAEVDNHCAVGDGKGYWDTAQLGRDERIAFVPELISAALFSDPVALVKASSGSIARDGSTGGRPKVAEFASNFRLSIEFRESFSVIVLVDLQSPLS